MQTRRRNNERTEVVNLRRQWSTGESACVLRMPDLSARNCPSKCQRSIPSLACHWGGSSSSYIFTSAYTSRLRRSIRYISRLYVVLGPLVISRRSSPLICSGAWTARGARARELERRSQTPWPPWGYSDATCQIWSISAQNCGGA